jgi:hypothetical protein
MKYDYDMGIKLMMVIVNLVIRINHHATTNCYTNVSIIVILVLVEYEEMLEIEKFTCWQNMSGIFSLISGNVYCQMNYLLK